MDSPLNWKVYSPFPFPSLTGTAIHALNLAPYHVYPLDHFPQLDAFYTDCANGALPSYSFLEPRFWTPHDDMHPSDPATAWWNPIPGIDAKGEVGSVQLGEELVRKVYEAIRQSPKRDKTLLIITFDEHGGCYDHVSPPSHVEDVTPPDVTGKPLENGFDFTRLGVRVPTIMVSSHIAKNTVVKTPMDHCSFMKTVGKKWDKAALGLAPTIPDEQRKFPPLTARVRDALEFTEVFTLDAPRTDWPVMDQPIVRRDVLEADYSQSPLNKLQQSILDAMSALPSVLDAKKRGEPFPDSTTIATLGEAENYLKSIVTLSRRLSELHISSANQGSLLYYSAKTGVGATAIIDAGGNYAFVNTIPGFALGWTHIAGASNGSMLFYNASTGVGATATIDAGGNYAFVSTIPGFSMGWTHIVGASNGSVFFYNALNGVGATATIDTSSHYAFASSIPGFAKGWTHIVFANQGSLLFYNAETGMGATATIDAGGHYAFVSTIPGFALGWTHIVGASNGSVLFYNALTGVGATATIDAGGHYAFVSAIPGFAMGWTHIVGASNGSVLFYNALTGVGATATIDADGHYAFVSTIPGFALG